MHFTWTAVFSNTTKLVACSRHGRLYAHGENRSIADLTLRSWFSKDVVITNRDHLSPEEIAKSRAWHRVRIFLKTFLPAGVNLPAVHNLLVFKHVVMGMLSRCQTRMICQNPDARPNFQTIESVLILHRNETVLLRHLADV
jgi:hypothetical protein